jgi:phosphoglucomutase
MLAEIGRREGFLVEETLTGFKWIGSRSVELEAEGKRNLFGYEEAIGFAWYVVGLHQILSVSILIST